LHLARLIANSRFSILASGELTESSAEALHQLLSLISLDRDKPWKLDLSRVSAMDATGAEVVASFMQNTPGARIACASVDVREFFAGFTTVPPRM
jgi:anti-anti-sigma regulatory factor